MEDLPEDNIGAPNINKMYGGSKLNVNRTNIRGTIVGLQAPYRLS